MLRTASCGFGYLALNALCAQQAPAGPMRMPPLRARAKRVIFLCMSGGPAQLDTFDYKPQTGDKEHLGSAFKFGQHGESGLWVSELMPETAKHADKLCVLNGMHADTGNHAQSFLQLHTGEKLRHRPSMGAWIQYGLGTENQNLPGFISLNAHEQSVYSSAFLPPIYSGTPIGINGEDMSKATIPNAVGKHLPMSAKRRQLDLIQSMNREHLVARPHDTKLESVIASMELGFRMQTEAPEVLDLSRESTATLERYRVGKNISTGTCRPSDFGRQCLLARRFAEAGVRFIEVNHGGWDQHKDHRRDLSANCETVDAPIAALLGDLDQRGMLEETLLVFTGEFGRTPFSQGSNGRDHDPFGFSVWLAGGGVKGGTAHGATDEFGYKALRDISTVYDLWATVLYQLGIDHEKLTYRWSGRDLRLTDVHGHVWKEILG